MAYIPRSSIGKSGTSSPIPKIVKKKRTFRVFGFLGTTLLLLSLAGSGGVFFFKNISQNQQEAARQELAQAEADVGDSEAKINIIMMYDEQLSTAMTLLDNHLAPSLLFEALELTVKETVQYQSLEYKYDPGFDALLTLKGSTKEFTSVVLQKLQLDEGSIDSPFEVALVGDVTKSQDVSEEGSAAPSEEERVTFTVTGLLKDNHFAYTGENITPEEDQQLDESVTNPETNEESNGEGGGDNESTI